jgi:hypothetical protein
MPTAQQEHQELWTRLNAYELDAVDAQLPFSKRLARENDWTEHYAKRVMNEYKRFVFLALASNHPVTPSDEIDQVWHLHLIYTKAYWEDFCKEVIRTPFHHHPTRGGKAEGDKFRKWYAKTKQAYVDAFGEEPPSDIWKNEQERFALAPHFKRINTKSNWVVPKPPHLKRLNIGVATLLVSAFSFFSCVSESEQINHSQLGMIIGLSLLAVMLGGILFAFSGKAKEQKGKNDTSGTGCGGSVDSGGDTDSSGGDGDGGGGSGCSGCGGCGS